MNAFNLSWLANSNPAQHWEDGHLLLRTLKYSSLSWDLDAAIKHQKLRLSVNVSKTP